MRVKSSFFFCMSLNVCLYQCSSGGAAVKAGVQEGDRIIKVCTAFRFTECGNLCILILFTDSVSYSAQVNGSLVSSMSHQEVVKLIKCEYMFEFNGYVFLLFFF